ncbi:MAG: FxLYD domain-containing protein [Candidatus Thiodiazotropha sp.]
MEILAVVENASDTTWSSVNLEAELFDESKNFVDECSGYLRGSIAPGEVKNVKIKCGGCKDSPLVAYSSYTIEIADASSF